MSRVRLQTSKSWPYCCAFFKILCMTLVDRPVHVAICWILAPCFRMIRTAAFSRGAKLRLVRRDFPEFNTLSLRYPFLHNLNYPYGHMLYLKSIERVRRDRAETLTLKRTLAVSFLLVAILGPITITSNQGP